MSRCNFRNHECLGCGGELVFGGTKGQHWYLKCEVCGGVCLGGFVRTDMKANYEKEWLAIWEGCMVVEDL